MVTYSPERERDIIQKISLDAEEPLHPEVIKRIYERIIDESRAIQKEESEKGEIYKVKKVKSLKFKSFFKLNKLHVSILLSAVILFLMLVLFTPNYYSGTEEKRVEVTPGESFSSVSDKLHSAGIIRNQFFFKVCGYLMGSVDDIKPGRYHVPSGLNYFDILSILSSGKADQLKIINLYAGISLNAIASKLAAEKIIIKDSLLNFFQQEKNIAKYLKDEKSFRGYLLPGVYQFYENSRPDEIVAKMVQSFNNFYTPELVKRGDTLGYTVRQILTLASIIDGETNLASEMPRISGVYHNRLRIGMKLQADPTVQFAREADWTRLKNKDLKIDSPYNTYIYYGLPPGPINNPGKEAILAALYPEKHQYLYFVADTKGGHIFSSSFAEHKRNARNYYRWLDKRN